MRCRNWKGSVKISYEDIITIESNFASTGDVFPCISTSGNFKDVITDAEFARPSEKKDERVDLISDMQRNKYDWSKHVWAYKETVKPFQYISEEHEEEEQVSGYWCQVKEEEGSKYARLLKTAFLNCMFSNQIITAYGKCDGNRRGYKIDDNFLEYGRGELPYHGSTSSVWSVDVDRLYIPICVNQIHWISICVNLVNRIVDVFDCGGKKNNSVVEAFQSSERKKDFNVKQYTVSYVPMRGLNMSGNDYGAYSLKFIECHLLGLDFSLVNDENIKESRHKIAYDLWEAANDEVLQSRMSTFKPPKRASVKPVDLG
ncbi:hypothetical protein F2Q70_00012249 [Brassica cretica]|uniref:Ubiquitin-like protease family profile domain-containing protein n=1 Tax=Brassica cretica TaxID=69181 RepID=A0A8S9M6N7_BRACR|nr:hypothetical protein F2Q70_00012249 [Brassica cretica]